MVLSNLLSEHLTVSRVKKTSFYASVYVAKPEK